jgi:hypothetical protein
MLKYVGLIVVALVIGVLLLSRADQMAKPPLPVSIGFRQALMGPGLVAQFRNNSDTMLEVRATFRSTDTNMSNTYDLVLPAHGIREFGWMQGWQFVPGQQIELMNNRFRTGTMTVGGGVPSQQ